ncbi:MAG: response regulator transcription factor [Schleiferiaceae bacterium]|nr:response regulator transcription factor [Schleiferiaceae bacterium]
MKIVHIDDHPLILFGVERLIKLNFTNATLVSCETKDFFLKEIKKDTFIDLVIVDIKMEGFDDLSILKPIQLNSPKTAILVYSSMPEAIYGARALKLGAKGYLNKSATPEEILKAIKIVLAGEKYISNTLKDILFDDLADGQTVSPFDRLSAREFEIISKILEGMSTNEICFAFNLKPSTVSTHKAKAFEKLQISNVIELQNLAVLYGL